MSEYETTARPADIAYLYAIPIFDDPDDWRRCPRRRGTPVAALVIDKTEPIDALLADHDQQDALAAVAAIVGEELSDRALARRDRPNRTRRAARRGLDRLDEAGAFVVSRRKVREISDTRLGIRLGQTLSTADPGQPKRSTI